MPSKIRRFRPTHRAAICLACLALAAGCDLFGGKKAGAFDADVAMARVRTQLDFGYRIPNTPAHVKTGDWIVAELRARADTVIEQRWDHVTATGDTLHLRNILARFRPADKSRVLYLTHWDTRPVSDEAADPASKRLPMPGANDGASGVALLIGVADALKQLPPTTGVDLLFVDGEDYGQFNPTQQDVLLGSTYFAAHLPDAGYAPLYGVLFDMIGDADLSIWQEGNSLKRAPEVVSKVWDKARALGFTDTFVPSGKWTVTDDHIPLLDKGLRVIDVIDLDYPYHHTPQDTFDKVSAASLKKVGDLAVALLR